MTTRNEIATWMLVLIAIFAGIGVFSEIRVRQLVKSNAEKQVNAALGPVKPVDVLEALEDWRADQYRWTVVVIANVDGVIESVSRNSVAVIGWRPDELIGESIEKIIPERSRESHVEAYKKKASDGGIATTFSVEKGFCLTGDGATIPVTVTISEMTCGAEARCFMARVRSDVRLAFDSPDADDAM